jgi:mono/diheme cytochrome c family protein
MKSTTRMWRRLLLAGMALTVAGGAASAWAGATEGKAIYEKSCKMCHSIAGEGGKMAATGGPLDGAGAKHDEAWLKAYIGDPKSKKPDAKMPKPKLSDQDLNDVAAFVATLKK